MSSAGESRPAEERREALKQVLAQARSCTRCPELAATRRSVVFGAGNANAELMFVGEAPGASEDEQGLPFVGRAGKLLSQLLEEIGLSRDEVFIANTLKCLRYDAKVQLGDGTWERIGRLVRSRYDGDVLSVDSGGALVPRRVIGWHATPVAGRRVFRLTYASTKNAGAGRVGIQLTGDHPVMTERGWVRVEDLQAEDRIATGQGVSDLEFDVVCGTLLGDGCLQSRSSALTFSHSAKQAAYARFKADLLADFGVSQDHRHVAAAVGDARRYEVVHTRTRAHRALRILRSEFYAARKVVPDWLSNHLSPRMLAFWFMDDGHNRIRPGRRPVAEIATMGFSAHDHVVLMTGLLKLGLPAKVVRGRLHFDTTATERLSTLIAPYVPDTMRYKLNPEVAERVSFDPTLLRSGPRRVMYDRVEIEDISGRPRADTTFFCIDVEDNHNFVTAGGVVHNCRPPGNRDPQPIEIENCRSYLLRQVELIEPSVICSLGNFSTKLLRADPTGITRLHGQPEIIELGRRAVRLYPIYHPAAALYTPRMLETLREDFARLPELLASGPPDQPAGEEPVPEPERPAAAEAPLAEDAEEADQLGLF